VKKKVPHSDPNGAWVEPETVNAVKFEAFVFDILVLAERWLVVEASRREEFAP
jgi:UDP-N-acetylglucosamine/UDP-N-acetylgalactosamine diphosphorylase